MQRTAASGWLLLAGLLAHQPAANAANFTSFFLADPASPTFTEAFGINDQGTVVGTQGAAVNQGFVFAPPGPFTPLNFPGFAQTQVTGIAANNDKVGITVDRGTTHGFRYVAGANVFQIVDQPNTAFNQLLGISNNATRFAGYSSLDPAGAVLQKAYIGTFGASGPTFTDINALLPANLNSQATGINDAGAAVGFYLPASGPIASIGFLDVGGTITPIDPFGSTNTQALGIANNGEIVGFYLDANGFQHGYFDIGGVFTTFDPPGSLNTTINGVNDLGQFVGFETTPNDNVIGFVATPFGVTTPVPEPPSFLVLAAALLSLALVRRSRQRTSADQKASHE